MNRADFQKLARIRIREAKALLDQRLYDGAYYLAGYAVECAFKACIAKLTRKHDFPDKDDVNKSWTHDLTQRVKVARLEEKRKQKARQNKEFELRWGLARISHHEYDWAVDGRFWDGQVVRLARD